MPAGTEKWFNLSKGTGSFAWRLARAGRMRAVASLVAMAVGGVFFASEGFAQAEGAAAAKHVLGSAPAASTSAKVMLSLDFSDYEGGPVVEWLAAKGFEPKEGPQDRQELDLDVAGGAFILEAKQPVLGLILNERIDVTRYSRIRVEWGVRKFPRGASYDKGVNNEAVMVVVYFGRETIDSGYLFIPDLPYFIGIFLRADGRTGHPYVGRFHKKSGRYICLDQPSVDETIISEFEVATAFKDIFKARVAPPISGIAISSDASSSEGEGRSIAFVKTIEVIE